MGPGCLPGEHVIRFEVDVTPTNADLSAAAEDPVVYVFLAELPVKERSSVAQLKERLFSSWKELAAGRSELPAPASAQHLRIRDGKVQLLPCIMCIRLSASADLFLYLYLSV